MKITSLAEFQQCSAQLTPELLKENKESLRTFIKTPQDLIKALTYIDSIEFKVGVTFLELMVPQVINSLQDLDALLSIPYTVNRAKFIKATYNALKNKLHQLIKKPTDFRYLFNYYNFIANETWRCIFTTMPNEKLAFLIRDNMFRERKANYEQTLIISESMVRYLVQITSLDDFQQALYFIYPAHQTADIFTPLTNLVNNIDDALKCFQGMNSSSHVQVFTTIKNKLEQIISNAELNVASLEKMFKLYTIVAGICTPEELGPLTRTMKEKLEKAKGTIDTTEFKKMFALFTTVPDILYLFKDNLSEFITIDVFVALINSCKQQEERNDLINKDNLITLINKDGYNLCKVMKYLTDTERAVVYSKVEDSLSEISIANHSVFIELFNLIEPTKRTALCEAVLNKLPQIIGEQGAADNFIAILKLLSLLQKLVVYAAVEKVLAQRIKNISEFKNVYMALPRQVHESFCAAMIRPLSSLIATKDDFIYVSSLLTVDQCKQLCQAMDKAKLTAIINQEARDSWCPKIFSDTDTFAEEKYKVICQVMLPLVTEYDDNSGLAAIVTQCISEEKRDVLTLLPKQINNYKQFERAFQWACLIDKAKDFCEGMTEQIPNLIQNEYEFKRALSATQNCSARLQICQAMKKNPITQYIPVTQLNDFIEGYFKYQQVDTKMKVQQLYFDCLLNEIEPKLVKGDLEPEAKKHAGELYAVLRKASTDYFIESPTSSRYQKFQKTCNEAIQDAKIKLTCKQDWIEFLARVLLAVISVGMLPLAASVVNKVNTNSWDLLRFFKTDNERLLDGISEAIIQDGKIFQQQ